MVDEAVFLLSPEEWQAFLEVLERPSREIPALRELFAERSKLEGETPE